MKQEKKKLIHNIYSIVLSAAIVVTGLLLMAACLQVYRSGGQQIYTPEKVAQAFGRIAVPVYVCLGLLAVSMVLQFVLWQTPGKAPKRKYPAMQLRRLLLTRDPSQTDNEKQAVLRHLRCGRRAMKIVCIVLCALCAAVFVFFALINSTFYPEPADATKYVLSLMPVFTPCVTLALGYGVLTEYLIRRNTEKLIAIYKQCPPLPQPKTFGNGVFVAVTRYVVLGLALCLVVWGLVSGGWQDVLTKAVNICTECVGLG